MGAEGWALPQDWGEWGVAGWLVPNSDFIRLAGMQAVLDID